MKGELSYFRNGIGANERELDAAINAILGGDLSLESEYWRAHTRATALEGELYVITHGGHDRIVSVASLFGPGRSVFGRSVYVFLCHSFPVILRGTSQRRAEATWV